MNAAASGAVRAWGAQRGRMQFLEGWVQKAIAAASLAFVFSGGRW